MKGAVPPVVVPPPASSQTNAMASSMPLISALTSAASLEFGTHAHHQESFGKDDKGDIADKLERLAMLHATGALTDSEFALAKSMTLGL